MHVWADQPESPDSVGMLAMVHYDGIGRRMRVDLYHDYDLSHHEKFITIINDWGVSNEKHLIVHKQKRVPRSCFIVPTDLDPKWFLEVASINKIGLVEEHDCIHWELKGPNDHTLSLCMKQEPGFKPFLVHYNKVFRGEVVEFSTDAQHFDEMFDPSRASEAECKEF